MDKKNRFYVLPVITLLSGILITSFYYLLYDKIEETKSNKELKIKKLFFPEGQSFDKVSDDLILVKKENNEEIGYILYSEDMNGYGGKIKIIVALDKEWKVKDFLMTEHSETPGLGSKANSKGFRDGFKGKRPLTVNLPMNKKEFRAKLNMKAISGATITSMSIVRAVAKKADKYLDWWMNRLWEKKQKAYQFYEKMLNR